jgi:hypothetical protein
MRRPGVARSMMADCERLGFAGVHGESLHLGNGGSVEVPKPKLFLGDHFIEAAELEHAIGSWPKVAKVK